MKKFIIASTCLVLFAGCSDEPGVRSEVNTPTPANDASSAVVTAPSSTVEPVNQRNQTAATDPAVEQTRRATEQAQQTRMAQQQSPQPQLQQEQQVQQQQQQRTQESRQVAPEGAAVQDSASLALHQEKLNVDRELVAAGGILLRKQVISDEVNETVSLRNETLEVVRLSAEEARQYQDGRRQFSNDPFTEEEIFIPLMKEVPVVSKEIETSGYVQAEKGTETVQEEVSAVLRREEVNVTQLGEVGTTTSRQSELERNQTRPAQETAQAQQGQQTSQSQQVARLKEEIEQQLTGSHLNEEALLSQSQLDRIDIQVQRGTVILEGAVESEQQKRQIAALIEEMESVQTVSNRLEVVSR